MGNRTIRTRAIRTRTIPTQENPQPLYGKNTHISLRTHLDRDFLRIWKSQKVFPNPQKFAADLQTSKNPAQIRRELRILKNIILKSAENYVFT